MNTPNPLSPSIPPSPPLDLLFDWWSPPPPSSSPLLFIVFHVSLPSPSSSSSSSSNQFPPRPSPLSAPDRGGSRLVVGDLLVLLFPLVLLFLPALLFRLPLQFVPSSFPSSYFSSSSPFLLLLP